MRIGEMAKQIWRSASNGREVSRPQEDNFSIQEERTLRDGDHVVELVLEFQLLRSLLVFIFDRAHQVLRREMSRARRQSSISKGMNLVSYRRRNKDEAKVFIPDELDHELLRVRLLLFVFAFIFDALL